MASDPEPKVRFSACQIKHLGHGDGELAHCGDMHGPSLKFLKLLESTHTKRRWCVKCEASGVLSPKGGSGSRKSQGLSYHLQVAAGLRRA